jgi:hypothetical protein
MRTKVVDWQVMHRMHGGSELVTIHDTTIAIEIELHALVAVQVQKRFSLKVQMLLYKLFCH